MSGRHPAKVAVFEGATGILKLLEGSQESMYYPCCDMDAARELLLEFQELKDSSGSPLKNNYRAAGHNWYPAMVSHLYWYLFIPWVKFRPLAIDLLEGKKSFKFSGGRQFQGLADLLAESRTGPPKKRFKVSFHDFLWRLNNRLTVSRRPWDLVFFRFAFHDFRSQEILAELNAKSLCVLEAVPAHGSRGILRSILGRKNHYYYAQPPRRTEGNQFRRQYPLQHLEFAKSSLFKAGIQLLETTLTACIRDTAMHQRNFRRAGIRLFYGFDDVNSYFFPLLFAARALGVPTIGHQHGAYVKRHAGYIMEQIAREDLEWYDRVIVWGDYWRNKMVHDAPVHPPERWVVGATKLKFAYSDLGTTESGRVPKSILIPYEFLADTATIGKFITKFVEFGYEVWFRPRVDESLEAQIDAYQLQPPIRNALHIASGPLNDVFLAKIDIVAGTMTTLVYELLPANKIIWYLDTPYRHLFDLVEEGYAHLISLEDLPNPPKEKLKPTKIEKEYLFSSQSISETLQANILGSALHSKTQHLTSKEDCKTPTI